MQRSSWATQDTHQRDQRTTTTRPARTVVAMDRHARHRRRAPDPRRRPTTGWRAPSLEVFLRLVDRAMGMLPAEFRDRLDNVEIAVEHVPPGHHWDHDRNDGHNDGRDGDQILLGLYEGVPVPEQGLGEPLLPARVTVFRGPLEARAVSAEHLAHEVAVTVLHELAHHFGIDDDRLDELGWS